MAKAQGKKAAGGGKSAAKKVVARVKSAAGAAKKKVVPAKKAKPAAKKAPAAAKKKPAAAKKKAAVVQKAKAVAKAVKKAVVKATKKPAKAAAASRPSAPPPAAGRAGGPQRTTPKPPAKPAAPEVRKVVAPVIPPAAPKPKPAPAPEPEKKRGRRARPRVTSNGVPSAAWLSTEKPRPASFIPAPPRAEAPSAIAAPPASSDRLIRDEDLTHPSIRTVPVRIDVEQGQGRFHVIPNPTDAQVRSGEAIEWDFRYIGGADFSVEEIVIEFEKPSPFAQNVYKTRKPGGARPHRQISSAATGEAGRTYSYTITAMTPFKTSLVSGKATVTVV